MGWPVRIDAIKVWRNDRWSRTWPFFTAPPAWTSGHTYIVGVVGSGQYVPNSTVSFGTTTVTDAQGVTSVVPAFYTCTTANSDASFTPAHWSADPDAVGAPMDLSAFGQSVAGQLREKPDDPALADMDLSDSDLAAGQITAKFTADMWAVLDSETGVGFDIEIRSSTELPLTVLVGKFSISKDWTHV